MKILCSAGKGAIEIKACLGCALASGKPDCDFDYALLRAMFDQDHSESRRNELHVTDLTGCLRRAWYDKLEPSPEYVHEMLAKWMGTAIHAAVEDPHNEHLYSELELGIDGIVGKSDIVYKDGRLVDIKTTKWIYPDKLPYGSHTLQVNIYAHLLRLAGREINRLQIQYICTSGPTKCRACNVPVRKVSGEFRCPVCGRSFANGHLGAMLVDVDRMEPEYIANILSDRKESLRASMDMSMPPARETGYLCSYCSSVGKCQPEISEQ